ncbi:MAG: hypothetical protein ACJA1Z_003083 [Patiriisocius sp.]|jgi:hypothetical protein|tara:strand:- start:1704 stop:2006 length:303 start_codon:yes stop_codon:yes gene_type:complete
MSCGRPACENNNLALKNNSSDSKLYKDELVNELSSIDYSQLTYWFQEYDSQNGKESLYFNIQAVDYPLFFILLLMIGEIGKCERGIRGRSSRSRIHEFKI